MAFTPDRQLWVWNQVNSSLTLEYSESNLILIFSTHQLRER